MNSKKSIFLITGAALVCSMGTTSAGDGVCAKCEMIREYNAEHPNKSEYYEDYLKEHPDHAATVQAPQQNAPQQPPQQQPQQQK